MSADLLQRKEKELRVVREAAAAVNGTLDLDEVLARILLTLQEQFGFRHAMVLLAQPDGSLEVKKSLGYDESGVGVRVLPGQGPIGVVAKRRKLLRLSSMGNKVRYAAATQGGVTNAPRLPGLEKVESTIAVPMLAGDQLIGVFAVESGDPVDFDADDERLIETVGNLAAAAVRNAALYQDLVATHRSSQRFVPHEFVHFLDKRTLRELARGDHVTKQMTIFFSDIRSFTTLVEKLDPAETFELLNGYFAALVPSIQAHHGFVDKFIGDAIMALFDESHVDAALDAAVGVHRALEGLNAARKERGLAPIAMGVGLHTGPLTLGTVGSEDRLSCTAYGDSVNLASRIEGLTKSYDARVLLSEGTHAALAEPSRFALRRVDRVRVKGKDEPVSLYESLDALSPEERAARAPAEELEAAFLPWKAGRFEEARRLFLALAERFPNDPVPALFLRRCHGFIGEPPANWDGAVRLDRK